GGPAPTRRLRRRDRGSRTRYAGRGVCRAGLAGCCRGLGRGDTRATGSGAGLAPGGRAFWRGACRTGLARPGSGDTRTTGGGGLVPGGRARLGRPVLLGAGGGLAGPCLLGL